MFSLGYPDFNDVEQAAKLLLEYEAQKLTSPEFYESFAMGVYSYSDVRARADEIRANQTKASG